MRRFAPGDTVVWRTVVDGRVRTVIPHRCVEHRDDLLALWRPAGTVYKRPSGPYGAGPRGRSLHAAAWDGTYRDLIWHGDGVLVLHRLGDWHSTLVFPDAWYVNLEAPWEPNPVGYDSRDLMLDVVISRDRTSWSWKDEDETADCVRTGRLSEDDARKAREEGERVAAAALRGDPPFDDGWASWRPDPSWPIPVLPDGWDHA